jgi:hypothetical protein
MSSSSFSRCTICFQTGIATVIMTAATLIPTIRTAIAYPLSRPWTILAVFMPATLS